MKRHLPTLAASAALLLCHPLQAEAERPAPPKPSAPAKDDGSGEAHAPKKNRPPEEARRKATPPPKTAPKADRKPSPERAAAKSPWVGIATEPVGNPLREHLEIPEGFGVQVVEVMPGSPAAEAGLRTSDIVLRFEDQRLVSPEHLALLVRSKAVGDKVPLALIRKGRDEIVEIVLGEADEDAVLRGRPFRRDWRVSTPPRPGEGDADWQGRMRRRQDDFLRRRQEWTERHRPLPPAPRPKGEAARPEVDRPAGRPPRLKVNPGFPLRIFGAEGVLEIDNERGTLTLTRKDGEHHLVIEDADGRVVHEGAFDPEKGVESLPVEAQRQLEAMKLDNLEIRLPDSPEDEPGEADQAAEDEDPIDEAIL